MADKLDKEHPKIEKPKKPRPITVFEFSEELEKRERELGEFDDREKNKKGNEEKSEAEKSLYHNYDRAR